MFRSRTWTVQGSKWVVVQVPNWIYRKFLRLEQTTLLRKNPRGKSLGSITLVKSLGPELQSSKQGNASFEKKNETLQYSVVQQWFTWQSRMWGRKAITQSGCSSQAAFTDSGPVIQAVTNNPRNSFTTSLTFSLRFTKYKGEFLKNVPKNFHKFCIVIDNFLKDNEKCCANRIRIRIKDLSSH